MQVLHEGFSILPILKKQELNSRLCPLKRRRESASSSVEIKETCVSTNLVETARLPSEKREEWIRQMRKTTRNFRRHK